MSQPQRFISARAITILIALVLVILSLTVVLMRRISFQAETSAIGSASVSISPVTAAVALGGELETAIAASVGQPAVGATCQLDLLFNRDQISPKELTPAAGWRTIKTQDTSSGLIWTLVAENQEASSDIEIGGIKWQALAEGTASIKIGPLSQLVMVEPGISPAPQNLALQSQIGSITVVSSLAAQQNPPPATTIKQATEKTVPSSSTTTPKQIIFAPSAAILSFHANLPQQITVRYGTTTDMVGAITTTNSETDQLVRLPDLTPGQSYYYQVSAFSTSTGSQQFGSLRSFVTPTATPGTASPSLSQLIVFPGVNSTAANLYLLLNNDQGSPVSGVTPSLALDSLSDKLSIRQLRQKNGYFTASITSSSPASQEVPITISVDGTKLFTKTLTLGQITPQAGVTTEKASRITSKQLVEIGLGGFFMLLALSLVYLRLTRLK